MTRGSVLVIWCSWRYCGVSGGGNLDLDVRDRVRYGLLDGVSDIWCSVKCSFMLSSVSVFWNY